MKKIKIALAALVVAGSSLILSSCEGNTGNTTGNTTGAEPDQKRITGTERSGDLPGTGREDTAGIIATEADTLGPTTGSTTGR